MSLVVKPPISQVSLTYLIFLSALGEPHVSKSDEFLEKFQTAFDPLPPLIFGKLYCGFCDKIATKVHMFSMAGLLCII